MFHDIGHALETVFGWVAAPFVGGPRGDGEEGSALEEKDLLGFDSETKVCEVALDDGEVGNEVVDNGCPCLVKALVPDGSRKWNELHAIWICTDRVDVFARLLSDDAHAIVVHRFTRIGHDEIHLVDEDVDLGGWGEL